MATIEEQSRRGRKSSKTFVMLFLSLALGAGGVYLAKGFIENKVNYYKSQLEKTEEMVKVVVPVRPMARGEVVTASDLALREMPARFAHDNGLTEANHGVALGQRLSFDVGKGKPLLWAHLEGGLTPTFSGKLEDGFRALTVPVNEVNSISGFLQPTDNIDLFLTYKDTVFPVMQNLHVLATGIKTETDKTGRSTGKTYNTITVQVTTDEAKKIVLAQSVGKLTATLRNPKDEGPIPNHTLTVSELLNKP